MPIPSGFKALVATYRKGYQRFSASPTIAKLNAYISGQIATEPTSGEFEAVSTEPLDSILPDTPLTPEQKLAIAKIFIEEQPVLPHSQSYKTWQKILRQYYLTAPTNTSDPRADEVTDQPRVERLHRDLQHLSQKGLLDIEHMDVIHYPEDPLRQINDLKTNVNVALKNVLQAYDNGWGNRWWVKTAKTRSPTMQRIAGILAQLPDFNQESDDREAKKALNAQKLNIIVSGFTPRVMTEDSASYRAWSQMTQLLLYPDNTKDPQEVIDARIKDIYHYLKNNNAVVANAIDSEKTNVNAEQYNKFRNHLRGSTVLLSNDKAPQPSTSWCCHFSFFSWKKTYPTAVPIVTGANAEQLAYVVNHYPNGLSQEKLALLLSKQLPESDSPELVQQHYYFITQCIEHNRFRDILRFSTDSEFILDILKGYFSDPAYQHSNQGIAQNNINAKLCLLLTPRAIATEATEPRLDARLRGGLFALCARRVDPDSITVLNSLLPTPLAADPPPNKGALIKAARDYSKAHADVFLTEAECKDLKTIDLKTIRSPTSSSPVTANTTAGDPHQEAKDFLRTLVVAPNSSWARSDSGAAYKKKCREALIAAISTKEGEISGFNEKILVYLKSIPPKGATGITIIDALRLDFNGKSYSSGNTLQSVITALRTDIKDTQSAIAARDSSKKNIV